jgi:hypothetical protein
MKTVTFKPSLSILSSFSGSASIPMMNAEVPLAGASVDFALEHGGPLVKRILNSWTWDDEWLKRAVENGYNQVIDVRIQRLMPGMYPSIPGWHCDAVPRSGYHSQPDFKKADVKNVMHYTALISTDDEVCNTEFLTDELKMEINPERGVWEQVHRKIEEEKPVIQQIAPGALYRFGQLALHRAAPTKVRGWRLFFRLSIYYNKPLNVIPRMQQVYLISEKAGW